VNRIAPGAPLRKELVRGVTVIQQGQAVKVVAQGQGFVVSTEAKALSGATVGAVVQAKTRTGGWSAASPTRRGRSSCPMSRLPTRLAVRFVRAAIPKVLASAADIRVSP
jgi:hypothetical protein